MDAPRLAAAKAQVGGAGGQQGGGVVPGTATAGLSQPGADGEGPLLG